MSLPPAAPVGSGWRDWMMRSRSARPVGTVIAVMAGMGMVGAAVVIVATLILGRALNVSVLLLPGIPFLVLGQAWMVAWLMLRKPAGTSWGLSSGASWNAALNPRAFFFGPLGARLGRALLAIALLGWLSAFTAVPSISSGGPAAPGAGCRYRLANHGNYTCVSQAAYLRAGAGQQRFFAGVILSFFALHLGAALGGRRAQAQPPPG